MIFKKGDKVKCIKNTSINILFDKTYTVLKTEKRNKVEFIYFVEGEKFIGYLAKDFELVK